MNEFVRSMLTLRTRPGAIPDVIFRVTTRFFAFVVLALMFAIMISLIEGGWPALEKFGASFLTRATWNPVTGEFGALSQIYGTLVTSLIAMLIAIPASFGIAFFITELAPSWIKRPITTAIELLAAIPSIIYGMWGLFALAPWLATNVQPWMIEHIGDWPLVGALFSGPPLGIGVFTAGLILAIMVLPFITAVMCDVFVLVPDVQKESAYSLGSTTWEVTRRIVIPYTRTGIVGGIMLGLGRALGETMAVTFVIGNANDIHSSLFMPGNTIASSIANEFNEASSGLYTSSLIALGLVLFVITFLVLAGARLMLWRMQAREGGST